MDQNEIIERKLSVAVQKMMLTILSAQLFKRCNLEQNYLDSFAIQGHVICLTFIPVVQNRGGFDQFDPDPDFSR